MSLDAPTLGQLIAQIIQALLNLGSLTTSFVLAILVALVPGLASFALLPLVLNVVGIGVGFGILSFCINLIKSKTTWAIFGIIIFILIFLTSGAGFLDSIMKLLRGF